MNRLKKHIAYSFLLLILTLQVGVHLVHHHDHHHEISEYGISEIEADEDCLLCSVDLFSEYSTPSDFNIDYSFPTFSEFYSEFVEKIFELFRFTSSRGPPSISFPISLFQ